MKQKYIKPSHLRDGNGRFILNLQLFADETIRVPFTYSAEQEATIVEQQTQNLKYLTYTGTVFPMLDSQAFNFSGKDTISIPFFSSTGHLNGEVMPANNPTGEAVGPVGSYPAIQRGNPGYAKIVYHNYRLRCRRAKYFSLDKEDIDTFGQTPERLISLWVRKTVNEDVVPERDSVCVATLGYTAERAIDETGSLISNNLTTGPYRNVQGLSNVKQVDWEINENDATKVAKEKIDDTIAANKFAITLGQDNINAGGKNLFSFIDANHSIKANESQRLDIDQWCMVNATYLQEIKKFTRDGLVEVINNYGTRNGWEGIIINTIYSYNGVLISTIPNKRSNEYIQLLNNDGDGGFAGVPIYDKAGATTGSTGEVLWTLLSTKSGGNGIMIERSALGAKTAIDNGGDDEGSCAYNIVKYQTVKVNLNPDALQKDGLAEASMRIKYDTICPIEESRNIAMVVIRKKLDQPTYDAELNALKLFLNSISNFFPAAVGTALTVPLKTYIGNYGGAKTTIDVVNAVVNSTTPQNAGSSVDPQELQGYTASITVPAVSGKFADTYELSVSGYYSNAAQKAKK